MALFTPCQTDLPLPVQTGQWFSAMPQEKHKSKSGGKNKITAFYSRESSSEVLAIKPSQWEFNKDLN